VTVARKKAVSSGKLETDNRCIFTGLKSVDGMHFYPANEYPQLADLSSNIFAGSRNRHSSPDHATFDTTFRRGVKLIRPVSERLWMLQNLTLEEFREVILTKIFRCEIACIAADIEFPDPIEPKDLQSLLRGIR